MLSWLIPSIVIILVGAGLWYWLNKALAAQLKPKDDSAAFTMLNQNIQGMQQRLDTVSSGLNTRLDNAAKVISDVNKELGQVQEIGRSMRDLQQFLQSPKLRGNIGEQVLHDLLSQNFPQNFFEMQYKFRSGEVVDALLKTDNGLIGIDSKFPLTNFDALMKASGEEQVNQYRKLFQRDVKKHISDIAKKYILPEEGTVNFALMYIPSEAIYYEIIRDDVDMMAHAQQQKVLLVSPNSFYYFLRVIMIGMQGKKIEEQAHAILASLQGIRKDSDKFARELEVLTTHLTNAKSALDRVANQYHQLDVKIDQIKLLE
jgi:DNA recombination protein RmuC